MKEVWASFRLAFSMYSIFPARQIKKTRRNMKYILIFVPLVGAIIGFILKQWQVISPYLIDKDLLGAVICAMLPIFLSGGAFLDGFFRTVDALSSHQPREVKLEILRDSHSGYFAIIICVCYFFLIVGLWSEMPLDSWPVLAYGFILSRALYGLSIECFPHSQESKCSLYVGKGKSNCDRIYDRLYRDLCSGHADVRHSGSDSVSGRCTARIFVLLLCGVPSFRGNYRGYRMLLCSGV